IGVQFMRAEPSFVGAPFRILCDFESETDLAFIADAPAARVDPQVAHTGGASLRLPAGVNGFTLKLASLLPPGNFPGSWTLIGGYFISREPVAVQVSYEVKGKVLLRRTVQIEPRKWTTAFLDISSLADPNADPSHEVGVVRFAFERADVWCDDLIVLDNANALVGDNVK